MLESAAPHPEKALKRWGRKLLGANAVGGYIRAATLQKRLKPFAGEFQRVFEGGCGSGANLGIVLVLAPKAEISGCDVSETELAKARSRLPSGRFFLADLTQARGEANQDLVLNVDVLEHIDDYQAALAGLASFLKPGGLLALHTPCDQQRRFLPLRAIQKHWQDDHEREGFDLDALARDLEAAGLEVIHRERTVGTWSAIIWELDFLLRRVKPINFLFLPLWKLLVFPVIGANPKKGNGVFLMARKKPPR